MALRRAAIFKAMLRQSCFIVNFVNFLKATFLQNNLGRLILSLWNVFAISVNLFLFGQCGFSRNKSLEAVVRRCSSKQAFLKISQISEKVSLESLFLINLYSTLLKKTPTQLLSCEIWEIFKNTFLTPPVAAFCLSVRISSLLIL